MRVDKKKQTKKCFVFAKGYLRLIWKRERERGGGGGGEEGGREKRGEQIKIDFKI